MTKISVAIDARLPDSLVGGVQQVICSLAQGFSLSNESQIDRTWIVYEGTFWWKNYIPTKDRIIEIRPPAGRFGLSIIRKFPKVVSFVSPWIVRFLARKNPFDHLLRELHVDLVHLPFQEGFNTELPYIYHPHDLQHCHHPEFFSRQQILRRDSHWSSLAKKACVVISETSHVSADLRKYWNIENDRIEILPSPPPIRVASSRKLTTDKYMLYPAAFWLHKNHSRLIDAISLLKAEGIFVKLVFTGAKLGEYEVLRNKVINAGLIDQIIFKGHLSDENFMDLFENATGVVIPTLFESYSLPIWEALRLGIPVACSNIDALPDQVGDAGLLFDPLNVESISIAVGKIWSDSELRQTLSSASKKRTEFLNPEVFANAFCALYRKALVQPAEREFSDALQKIQSVSFKS